MSDNIGMRVGAAGHMAANILASAVFNSEVKLDDVPAEFKRLLGVCYETMEKFQAEVTGETLLRTELGATPAAPADNVVPIQPQPAAPAAAPAPPQVPGQQDGDPEVASAWNLFFQNPGDWWDNRYDKRNPKAPDFKHKSQKGTDGYNLGLWINSKKNPSWVPGKLAEAGY